jgi:hypothetical protein
MRVATILLAGLVAVGLGASAPAEDSTTPTGTAATDTDAAATEGFVPCSCGGPKAIYAAQYGTVQPPVFREMKENAEVAPADAAQPAAVTPSPESDGAGGG